MSGRFLGVLKALLRSNGYLAEIIENVLDRKLAGS